ncbi:hypothetical protein IWW55_001750 [Coemansia sp. RSA 2706]|nr:hypothetical protein IWW55_001750 [Coemansia sp. RSA 2706]KAJ2313941.1 hypothetical protein IWW54_001217 [Coemansia sp. RSA 2705]KAJ2327747.1 hypothetical protein IWW51_001575 [Coemansia sp. RSA 2702]KAJ2368427.1 hypothetical protein H4S01_001596 [Coemansia sp. RSA 2610]
MGLSSASRKFKTLRRKRDRLPIGTIIDNAGHTYAAGDGHASSGHTGSREAKASLDSASPPPPLAALPSDVSSRISMTGSGTQDDLVVYRLNSWRNLVKEYTSYFEAFAAAQKAAKKALDKAVGDFDVPLKSDHCFAGVERDGVQQLSAQLRDMHRMYATQYSRVIQHTESNTLEQLEALRAEIKDSLKEYTDHLNPIYRRLRKQAKEVEEYKEKLVRAVEAYKKRHRGQDAWLVQQQVRRELTRQAELENALVKAMRAEHQRLIRWEASLSERFRDVVASTMVCERDSLQTTLGAIGDCLGFLDRFDTHAESRAFDQHFASVLDHPMGLTGASSLADYDYMHKDSDATTVLLEGALERESGMLKKYHHEYAVLTAQGYLHCFAEQKDLLERNPEISFHLADCSITPLDDVCSFVVASEKKLGRSKYGFRGSDPASVDHWINAISSVISKPPTPELTIVGGTLRDSKAAMAAAAAASEAPNTLPTAAGIPTHELAARNAAEDEKMRALSPVHLDTPIDGEHFYPAQDASPMAMPEPAAADAVVPESTPGPPNLLATFEHPTATT